jgi:cell division FtsZ-interacting protein ZapD
VQLTAQVTQIQKGINQIMAIVQIDQTQLDSLATALEAVKTSLAAEIASLQTSLPAADLSGLNQALTDLQGLEPPAPTPAP